MEQELNFLKQENLSPNELVFIRTLLILQEDSNEEYFANYLTVLRNQHIEIADLIKSLQEKGIILKSYHIEKKGTSFDPHEIPFNKNFTKRLHKCSFDMGKELFEAYPQSININGVLYNGRSISDKFDSLEDAYFRYAKLIKWNPEKHKQILDLLKWANDHSLVNTKLSKFISDQAWTFLESIKNGDSSNINFDAVKLV